MKTHTLGFMLCVALQISFAASTTVPPKLHASELPSKLPKEVQLRVAAILLSTNELIAKAEYRKAVESALDALAIVPDPKDHHPEMVQILATIGEANFRAKAFEQ